ncbi:MAG TPA: HPr(Ser) kinase/phosphatase [Clostridiales bacterium]|jgi:HPr kinase/phosphorylase|nr:HPr(Ser) kinase/phosphatase [Clostridiales bacterium]
MNSGYSISLHRLIEEFGFEEIYVPDRNIAITNPEVNRPGLALAGFFELFEPSRIQIVGRAEHRYLSGLTAADRARTISSFMKTKVAAVIITTGLEIFEDFITSAKENGVPLLRSKEKTSPLMAALIASLNLHLAPRITRHGVLVEVYGEGLLLLGDSGVGKSETAIELVKRGHRLIADDAVEIKRASAKTLVGSAPEIIRHYVELRGIGIVDVRRLFGMGAVNNAEKIDLVINLEHWVQGKLYDRLGLDEQKINILGIELPCITIPVKPGRNLAIILEIAAMNNRLKKMGYNTAEEFSKKLMRQLETQDKEE